MVKAIFKIETIHPLNAIELYNILHDYIGDNDIKGVTMLDVDDLKKIVENESEEE